MQCLGAEGSGSKAEAVRAVRESQPRPAGTTRMHTHTHTVLHTAHCALHTAHYTLHTSVVVTSLREAYLCECMYIHTYNLKEGAPLPVEERPSAVGQAASLPDTYVCDVAIQSQLGFDQILA